MYIKNENDASRALYIADVMEGIYEHPGVEFSENGIANVDRAVGESLCDRFEDIRPHGPSAADSESGDDGGDDGDGE